MCSSDLDQVGNTTDSAPITVTIINTPPDTTPPSVAITEPGDGATIQNGQAVSAASSDADSGVAQVEFRF